MKTSAQHFEPVHSRTSDLTTWDPFALSFSPDSYARGQSHFQSAFWIIPSAARRRALNDLYAFCRVVDDISDRTDLHEAHRLKLIEKTYDWIRGGIAIGHPFWDRFLLERIHYGVLNDALEGIVAGVARDIGRVELRIQTWTELDQYCRGVACCVGEATLAILGAKGSESKLYADQMGKCLQYLNIMRDLAEDRAVNRVYIPQEFLTSFGWRDLPPEPDRQDIREELYAHALKFRNHAKPYSWRCLPAELMARIYLKGAKKYWRYGNSKRLNSFEKVLAILGF